MSTEPPAPLPDTDDPFELLGIAPRIGMRDLKRAYVSLIRQYRPETHPHEFHRIREAYDRARDSLHAPDNAAPPPVGNHDDGVRADLPPPAPPEEKRSTPPAPGFVGTGFDPEPETGETWASYTSRWSRAISEGADLSPFADHLDSDLVDALADAGSLDWSRLQHQPDPELSIRLFHAGALRRLVNGPDEGVLGDLEAPGLTHVALSIPDLTPMVYHLLMVTCWDDLERSRRILDAYSEDDIESPTLLWLDTVMSLAAQWSGVTEECATPPGLWQVLRLGEVGSDDAGPPVCRALEDLAQDDTAWLAALDAIHDNAPDLNTYLLRCIDGWVWPDDRVWDELPQADQDWGQATVADADRAIDDQVLTYIFVVLAAAVIYGFMQFGWWGLLGLLAGLVGLVWHTLSRDKALYRRAVRPMALERFARRGISPDRFIEAIADNTKLSDSIGRFVSEIEEDTPLAVLAALHRVRILLDPAAGEGAREEPLALATAPPCSSHPAVDSVGHCTHCGRAACEACMERDGIAGDHCVDCHAERLRARRTGRAGAERGVVILRCLLTMQAVLAALGSAGMVVVGMPAAAGVGMYALALLLGSIGLRLRRRWGLWLQYPLAGVNLFFFPLGTAIAVYALLRIVGNDTQALFRKDHREVPHPTVEERKPRTSRVIEPVGAALMVFAIGSGILLALAR